MHIRGAGHHSDHRDDDDDDDDDADAEPPALLSAVDAGASASFCVHGLQWHRASSGTPRSAPSMWRPQPAHVVFLHTLHWDSKHMIPLRRFFTLVGFVVACQAGRCSSFAMSRTIRN
jgi:hypothetical protein